jgi:hypothetical protein
MRFRGYLLKYWDYYDKMVIMEVIMMARKKKKQRKNNHMPPLHWVDKLIYIGLLTIAIGLLAAYFIFQGFTIEKLYFRETGVVAYNRHASMLWFFPTFFLLIGLIAFIYDKFSSRYPIFGIPNFLYGPSKYPRIYPIFSKDKPKKKITPKMKRNMLILWAILGAFFITTLSTSLMGFFGRDCLYEDGSVTNYSMFNARKEEYSPGEIAKIHISIYGYRYGRHRHYRNKHYGVAMTVTTVDGSEYRFKSRGFRNEDSLNWMHHMLQIKATYPESMVICDTDYIELLIKDRDYNEKELALLYQLFNMEP